MVNASKQRNGGLLGIEKEVQAPATHQQNVSSVKKPASGRDLDDLLEKARRSCAIIFFTSEKCAPCKQLYPVFDELAAEAGNDGTFIRIDIARDYALASRFEIQATPSFVTMLHGNIERRWSGANPSTLRGNVKLLLQMAWPPHPHEALPLPLLRGANTRAITFGKVPPLAKLKLKLDKSAEDASVQSVLEFISVRETAGAAEAHLPDLDAFSRFLRAAPSKMSPDALFPIVDLLRIALNDLRFSGYFAEEKRHATIAPLLEHVNSLDDCPYALRLVTLQTCCNLFTSPLYPEHILGCSSITQPIIALITSSLLDSEHHNVRVAAASLCFNMAFSNHDFRRREHREVLEQEGQIELAASLLEAIERESASSEALQGYMLAFGYLVFCSPQDGDLADFLVSLEAPEKISGKAGDFPKEKLVHEIGSVLLGGTKA